MATHIDNSGLTKDFDIACDITLAASVRDGEPVPCDAIDFQIIELLGKDYTCSRLDDDRVLYTSNNPSGGYVLLNPEESEKVSLSTRTPKDPSISP